MPAIATIITDPQERRRILTRFVEERNRRVAPDNPGPEADVAEWVARSPLARVDFVAAD